MAATIIKAFIVTFVLIGVLLALVGLVTKHWFEAKATEQPTVHGYSGLWEYCENANVQLRMTCSSFSGQVPEKIKAARVLSILAIITVIPSLSLFLVSMARNYRHRAVAIVIVVLMTVQACCQGAAVICAAKWSNDIAEAGILPLRLGWSLGLAAASSAMFGLATVLASFYYITEDKNISLFKSASSHAYGLLQA